MPTLKEASVNAQRPRGGVQAWSVGDTYPVTVVGLGNGPRVQWYAENLHTGERGPVRDAQGDAVVDQYRLWAEFNRNRLQA
ncbi:hypothetical protein [Ralstonia phage P-PSG-11-1]|uniref:Uncharacterized protein n=1 Tax=Ralstonia phage P-PSG-11 TaxID=2652430 RepID=A0A5P8D3W2_9CAUD|nr:hypothetical protein [Ralstonia phage P-PSG-11]QFP93743.1 hypothetical protein [Ralstonia phage P-PSG-11-1]UHX60244.1 hypothetical protein RsoPWF2_05 [Ralstonia phage vRsoP-WF2]UHX60296.1 hypothetical protein RsoPWM2_05 [Ralstonia phage vRsoP-WM2]UHX60348.1 hypothetical protein RsoPWR2_05 [Ralstonia phage vRsoP-WR2]